MTPTLTVPDGSTVQATLVVLPVTQDVQMDDGGTLELKWPGPGTSVFNRGMRRVSLR